MQRYNNEWVRLGADDVQSVNGVWFMSSLAGMCIDEEGV